MDPTKTIPISELLNRRRLISGAATLNTQRPTTLPPYHSAATPNPNSNPPLKILKTLPQPSVITGTFSLLSSTHTSPRHPCFSFSDDVTSVCCDVIDFDFSMIGRKLVVLSWNYIPFKKCGGLLEIIKWKFLDKFDFNDVDSFSLSVNDDGKCCDYKAKYDVCGVVQSVSRDLILPCAVDNSAGKEPENLRCFVVEMVNSDVKEFVYFSGKAAVWQAAFLRLSGRVIWLSGLRKKLVYVGKEEGRLMYVTSKVTRLRFPKLRSEVSVFRKRKRRVEGEEEFGVYIGVVSGIYMQGMVVKLDEGVWLLMTDESLILPHSVRVGAIVLVRNVHIVNPKFKWTKTLILGACCKTNITTISFSPLETGCHLALQSQSLLRKFVESLAFSARLWVLLVVQCFRRKFSGTLSEKEILGTKNNEGLVQTYAISVLPSWAFQLRHGIFKDFCSHGACGSRCKVRFCNLYLAVPLSNLLHNCHRILVRSLLRMKCGLEILEACSQVDQPFQENKFSGQHIRRIVPSKDLGISLIGKLKLSEATGRLQFIDATGSIDAVIPDLPSAWNMNCIYEVIDFSLVLEGKAEMQGLTWMLDDDLFSCSSIFHPVTSEKPMELTVYVQFKWNSVICRHVPIHHCLDSKDITSQFDPGTYHLLFVIHKFPMQPHFHCNLLIPGKCRLLAEVTILPWDLKVATSDEAATPSMISQDRQQNYSRNGFSFKRCRSYQESSCIVEGGLCANIEDSGNVSHSHSSGFLTLPQKARRVAYINSVSAIQIPCAVAITGLQGQMVVYGILCSSRNDGSTANINLTSLGKVLLEFDSESMFKYKAMRIGCYYVMKHYTEKCFCDSNDKSIGKYINVNSKTQLWSLSFDFDSVDSSCTPCNDPSLSVCSMNANELMVLPSSSSYCGIFSDVRLHFSGDTVGHLYVGVQALKDAVTKQSVRLADISVIVQHDFRNLGNKGAYSENNLPEGNLISLRGTVMRVHQSGCCDDGKCDDDFHLLKLRKEWKGLICMHVLMDGHMLQIGGSMSKYDYPVGLAPGADVIFYRILSSCGQKRLMLTPISFIAVHSVKEAPPDSFSFCAYPEKTITLCPIFDLIHINACNTRRFHCRVVGIQIVLMERNENLDKMSCIHYGTPIVNIPLVGFILDDGSSRCCCWANGERAATFLKLHEEVPPGPGASWWRVGGAAKGRSCSTSSFHLDKILKKHRRLTLKNYGSIHDTWSQDFHFSVGSDCILGAQDENLLKLIMLNACSSTLWSVLGHVMDSSSVNNLEKYLLEEQMTNHSLHNVWAREVCQVNALAEARLLLQEL